LWGVEERFNLVTQDWDHRGGHFPRVTSLLPALLDSERKLNIQQAPIEILFSARHLKIGPTR
jgi:hypothetical protein